jgi:hypothetical protein
LDGKKEARHDGTTITFWCKGPSGNWYEISQSFFDSCFPRFDIE